MIAILSPAKTLDFETQINHEKTKARLFSHSKELLKTLKTKDESDLRQLMGISDNLAQLNVERFQNFSSRHTDKNSKQSLFAFQGDVYQGLQADDFSESDLNWAQDHLRILSGLYGLLRPLDIIQPYRLEMGTPLPVNGRKNLYEFWGADISKALNKDLKAQGDQILINLASVEYFKSVDLRALKAKVIDVEFKDNKNGDFKIISFYAKKARGLMARYMVKNQVAEIDDLKQFNDEGYYFDPTESSDTLLAFKRD